MFFKVFSIEEKIFTLAALSKINCFDFYLCGHLLTHDMTQIVNNLDNCYYINYFKTPVRLDLCVVNILYNYVVFNQSTKQKFVDKKIKYFAKIVVEKIEAKIKSDLLNIEDFGQDYKFLVKILEVFDHDERKLLEIKLNDLILEKFFYFFILDRKTF